MASGGVTSVGTGQDSYVTFGSGDGDGTSADRNTSWVAPATGKIVAWYANYDGALDSMGGHIPSFSVHTIYYGSSNVTKTSDGGLASANASVNLLGFSTPAFISVNAGELVSCKVDSASGSGVRGTHTIVFRCDGLDMTPP